jgi:hypothetical protein
MKNNISKTLMPFALIALFLLTGFNAFSQGKPDNEKTPKEKLEKKAKKDKKPKKGKSRNQLIGNDTLTIETMKSLKYAIKKGQIISYTFKEHASVGITEDFSLDNTSILVLADKKTDYKNPNRENLVGADEARVTLYFKGAATGKTLLTINEFDKGKIKKSHKIEIIVE